MEGMELEKVTARSGETVFKWHGRLTASSRDPRRDAREWVESLRLEGPGDHRLLVLGVGSGYHLVELRSRFPDRRIMALDVSTVLIENAMLLHGAALTAVELIPVAIESDLLNSERLRLFLRGAFRLAEHPASIAGDLHRYREIKSRIVAREPMFFADWIRREERFARLFPLQSIAGGEGAQLLSIKDIARFADSRGNAEARDVLIVKALRELVK